MVAAFDPADGLAGFQVLQIPRLKEGKTFTQFPGILVADPEYYTAATVEDRASHFPVPLQLAQFLMRENEAQPIFPRPRKYFCHARRDEILKLIRIEPVVPAHGLGLPAHGGLLELRH